MFKPNLYLFVGFDIHKDNHIAVGINYLQQKKFELEIADSYVDYQLLLRRIQALGLKPIFGLEDSYGNGERLARFLTEQGFLVKVVNPVLVKRERQYKTHPEKSDPLDAEGVAKIVSSRYFNRDDTLPSYSITDNTELARDLKSLTRDRDFLVREQTRLKNQLHRLLYTTYGPGYRIIYQKDIFGKRALKFWLSYPSLKALKLSHLQDRKPEWVIKAKKDELPEARPFIVKQIRRKVKGLQQLRVEIQELEEEIFLLVEKSVPWMLSLKGCTHLFTGELLAEIKDINRFPQVEQFTKYAGVVPNQHSSGKRRRHLKTLAGNRRLNRVIYLIALSQIAPHGSPEAKQYYQKKLGEGKSKLQALNCLKHQLAKIIYHLLKEQRPYYPAS